MAFLRPQRNLFLGRKTMKIPRRSRARAKENCTSFSVCGESNQESGQNCGEKNENYEGGCTTREFARPLKGENADTVDTSITIALVRWWTTSADSDGPRQNKGGPHPY